MAAALEIQRLLHGTAARARQEVRVNQSPREPNLDWPPNTCTLESLSKLQDAAIESIFTNAGTTEKIYETELAAILTYVSRAEEVQDIDDINLSNLISENIEKFFSRWMIRHGDKYPKSEVRCGIKALAEEVATAQTKAETLRIQLSRQVQEEDKAKEPEHSYFKLAATNVNGKLRLKTREFILQQDDEALDDEAVVGDQTMQKEPDSALATILGWLQDPTEDMAGIWAVETHLDDDSADEIIDYLKTYHPTIGILVSIKIKDDNSASLVFLYRTDILEPLTPLQAPFSFTAADGHLFPSKTRLPKPRPENDRFVRHVWHGRLADIRLRWTRDRSEMISTYPRSTEKRTTSSGTRWRRKTGAPTMHCEELKETSTPRRTTPGRNCRPRRNERIND